MELYQIETFLVIARTGNLTRAARELHASQPTVSAQLKALEEELSVRLFVRSRHGMKLTLAGAQLRDKAQEVSDRVTELASLAASLAGAIPATVSLGLNTTAATLRVPLLLAALAEIAPRLRIDLQQGLTHTILADVASHRLDAGFFFGSCAHVEVKSRVLVELDLAIVGPTLWKHRLARTPVASVLKLPWVWPPEHCPFYVKTIEFLRPLGELPTNGVTADDEATVLDLVRAQVGVSLLPAFMVAGEDGVTVLRRIRSKIALGFAWHRAQTDAAHVRPLLVALDRIWQAEPLPASES